MFPRITPPRSEEDIEKERMEADPDYAYDRCVSQSHYGQCGLRGNIGRERGKRYCRYHYSHDLMDRQKFIEILVSEYPHLADREEKKEELWGKYSGARGVE